MATKVRQGRVVAGSPDEAAAQIMDNLGHEYIKITVKPVPQAQGTYEYCYTYKGDVDYEATPSTHQGTKGDAGTAKP